MVKRLNFLSSQLCREKPSRTAVDTDLFSIAVGSLNPLLPSFDSLHWSLLSLCIAFYEKEDPLSLNMFDNHNNFALWTSWKTLKLVVYLQCNTSIHFEQLLSTIPPPSLPLTSSRQSLSLSCICKRPKKNRLVKRANNYKSKGIVFSLHKLWSVPK